MKYVRLLGILGMVMFLLMACSFGAAASQPADDSQMLQGTITALEAQVQQLANQRSAPESPAQTNSPSDTAQKAQAPAPVEAPLEVPQPTAESLPTEPVPAGMPVVFDGWSVSVSQELNFHTSEEAWGVDIIVRNLTDASRVFRYMNASVTASDNLGNIYKPLPEAPYGLGTSCEPEYYVVRNVEVDGSSSKIISSGTTGNGCLHEDAIGMFVGTIPLDASELIIHLDDFGPLKDVDFVIEL